MTIVKQPAVTGTGPSSALRTDRYELTMVEAALASGVARHRAVFEVFARSLPAGRRYGMVAGLGRLVEAIGRFRFGPEELAYLRAEGFLRPETLEWLRNYRFSGDVDAYAEGELFFPYSPVLTIEASFAEALLLETVVLSVLNYDSAVASAASRMVVAAGGRTLVEMGGRRTQEDAAVAAARAAYVAGFDATSNLEAGRRYGVPTAGTVAHAFTMAHRSEAAAFAAQVTAMGPDTTLLVDTYDIAQGIANAVAAAGTGLGAVRIDSGDLAAESRRARALLDSLGATGTRIVVSSDLDEYGIAALSTAPVDAYGVGTSVATGSGAPAAGFVYKLVAIADRPGPRAALRPVAKYSPAKSTTGGRKVAHRLLGDDGYASAERVVAQEDGRPHGGAGGQRARSLQVPVLRVGKVVHSPDLAAMRAFATAARAELGPPHLALDPGPPALDATPGPGLAVTVPGQGYKE